MAKDILIFAEQRDGQFRKPALETASTARRLANELGGTVWALVLGERVKEMAATLGAYGVDRVLVGESEHFRFYAPDGFTKVMAEAVQKVSPAIVLFPATSLGKDLAPRVAAKLGLGLASDCTELFLENGRLEAKRPVYAGKAYVRVAFHSEPQMATLRPNVFPIEVVEEGRQAPVEEMPVTLQSSDLRYVVKEFVPTATGRVELTEADIIVSGGRGMKGPENFRMLEELADLLGAAVGASRAAVDAGWRPHSDQVGQTGKTVSPNLYIAVGISGAIQHLAGMSSSKCIVAINKDPEAPIFQKADYGIVGDLFEVVPTLIEEIKKLKAS